MPDSDDKIINEEFRGPPKKAGIFKRWQWHADHPGHKVTTILVIFYYLLIMLGVFSVIDSNKIGAFNILIVVVIAFPAIFLAEATWKNIGEGPRDILRFLARHWLRTIFVLGLTAVIVGKVKKGVPIGDILKGKGIMIGTNWRILEDNKGGYLKVPMSEAGTTCNSLGAEWKLLSSSEIPILNPVPQGHYKADFWLSDPVDSNGYSSYMAMTDKKEVKMQRTLHKPSPTQVMRILCLKSK